MGEVRDFRRPQRQRSKPSNQTQWINHPELQNFMTDVAFNTQGDLSAVCYHSAAVRLGTENLDNLLQKLVDKLWKATDQMGISLAQALVGVDSLRGDLMRHLIEQTAYSTATIKPAVVFEQLCSMVPNAATDEEKSNHTPET